MEEDPFYSDEEVLSRLNKNKKLKIPQRTFERYKAQIWKEDEPKRKQEEQDYIKKKLQDLRVLPK